MTEPWNPAPAAIAAEPVADLPPADPTASRWDEEPSAEPVMHPTAFTTDASGRRVPVPQLDFLTYEDASAQADILGGKVEHVGVAFTVKLP